MDSAISVPKRLTAHMNKRTALQMNGDNIDLYFEPKKRRKIERNMKLRPATASSSSRILHTPSSTVRTPSPSDLPPLELDFLRTLTPLKESVRPDVDLPTAPNGTNSHSPAVQVGEVLCGRDSTGRYVVTSVLGEGSYGHVLVCTDLRTSDKSSVAVKVMKQRRSEGGTAKAYRREVRALRYLAKCKHVSESCCILSSDVFRSGERLCIVFPLMGMSVYEFYKKNNACPYPIAQVCHIAWQLCQAVRFLHRNKVVHTDLKPENMVFVNSSFDEVYDEGRGRCVRIVRNSTIRLVDFGLASLEGDTHSTVIATRHYRTPEVLLELGWSYPADIWAVGCILFELAAGRDTLFMPDGTLEHLAMMQRFLGVSSWPRSLIKQSPLRRTYFHRRKLAWYPSSPDKRTLRDELKPLSRYWSRSDCLEKRMAFDLVKEMLCLDPSDRISVDSALRHPFFFQCSQARAYSKALSF